MDSENTSTKATTIQYITLRVGCEKTYCSKALLIRHSDYFKALFSGSFKDSETTVVDVSSEIGTMEDLNILLRFFKEGEVVLITTNLTKILKLAAFYGVESLTFRCTEYMLRTLSITNCIWYYNCAVEFALANTEPIKEMVASRFHDLLITSEELLSLTADEVLQLIKSHMFKYCSKESVFMFFIKWLSGTRLISDQHLKTLLAVSDYFKNSTTHQDLPFKTSKLCIDRMIERMLDLHHELNKESRDQIKEAFLRIYSYQENSVRLIDGFNDRSLAIFVFSERVVDQSIEQMMNYGKRISRSKHRRISTSNPDLKDMSQQSTRLFDICVYQPQTRVWYHIDSITEEDYFRAIDGHIFQPTKICSKNSGIFCSITATESDILFCDISKRNFLFQFNIRTKLWRSYLVEALLRRPSNVDRLVKFKVARSQGGKLFLVALFKDENNYEIRFCGYSVLFSSDHFGALVCFPVFTTESVLTQEGQFYERWSEMTVRLSSTSSELMILNTMGTGDNMVLIVDLDQSGSGQSDTESSYLVMHKQNIPTKPKEYLFVDVVIMETAKQFLIVSRDNESLTVRYEYKFHSKTFSPVKDTVQCKLPAHCEEYPKHGNEAECGHSYWTIESNGDFVSRCKRICFSDNGDKTIEEHTPPPFSRTIATFATEVDTEMFTKMSPARNFLLGKQT